jgi:hypothetical protein
MYTSFFCFVCDLLYHQSYIKYNLTICILMFTKTSSQMLEYHMIVSVCIFFGTVKEHREYRCRKVSLVKLVFGLMDRDGPWSRSRRGKVK